jgi:hypothetical protein
VSWSRWSSGVSQTDSQADSMVCNTAFPSECKHIEQPKLISNRFSSGTRPIPEHLPICSVQQVTCHMLVSSDNTEEFYMRQEIKISVPHSIFHN